MRSLLTAILTICLLSWLGNAVAKDDLKTFPKRQYYPQLNYILTAELATGLKNNQFNVVDVRDQTSFNALHIKNAANIFIKSKAFDKQILDLVNQNNKPLVIYCNGISCGKSYVASDNVIKLLKKKHIDRKVLTYDSGINAIAHAHNDLVQKNGQDISADNPLIAQDKIKQHTLKAGEFESYLAEHTMQDYALLDIRDKHEKIIFKLFVTYSQKNISLDKKDKLIKFLNKVKQKNKTLLVYDSAGRQINGLYELLTITGIKNWHYLEGGENGYAEYALNAAGL